MPFSAPLFIKCLVIFAYFLTTSQSASKRMHIISSSLRTANMTAIINNVTGYTENKVYPRIPEARGGGSWILRRCFCHDRIFKTCTSLFSTSTTAFLFILNKLNEIINRIANSCRNPQMKYYVYLSSLSSLEETFSTSTSIPDVLFPTQSRLYHIAHYSSTACSRKQFQHISSSLK